MSAKVYLVDSDRPFIADEFEFMESGWLRARGSYVRHLEDEAGDVVAVRTEPRELVWPPHQVRLVRLTGGEP